MLKVRTYRQDDFYGFKLQSWQQNEKIIVPDDAYTVTTDKGRVLVIFGLQKRWDNVYVAWSFISAESGDYMLRVFRLFQKILRQGFDRTGVNRVEAYVQSDFKAGNRLVKMLGFGFEGKMHRFYGQSDYNLWAKIKV